VTGVDEAREEVRRSGSPEQTSDVLSVGSVTSLTVDILRKHVRGPGERSSKLISSPNFLEMAVFLFDRDGGSSASRLLLIRTWAVAAGA
jgi:hypothetical protein